MAVSNVIDAYSFLFARKGFFRWNRFMLELSLHGLGILNHKNDTVSGEMHFLHNRLRNLVRPVVFDVGANCGNYSTAVLGANPDAQLFAFEPHPDTFKTLLERLAGRGVETINAACGSSAGERVLYDYSTGASPHASLYPEVIEELHDKTARGYPVEMLDLDTFTLRHGVEFISLLKIDTEGNELDVLRGAARLIKERRIEAIQFEFNAMNLISRTFFRDFFNLLPEYKFYRMVRDGLISIPEYSPVLCEIFAFQNIAAVLPASR